MAKKKWTAWTNHEVELVRKHFPTRMPWPELLAMLPRHTKRSIYECAYTTLKLRRPIVKAMPSWLHLREILEIVVMSSNEIAAEMGVTADRVRKLISEHRAEVHIKSWRWSDDRMSIAALWTLGDGPDAPKPMGLRRWRDMNKRRRPNPFLAAAGLVQAPTNEATGRVYKQAMEVEDDEVTA